MAQYIVVIFGLSDYLSLIDIHARVVNCLVVKVVRETNTESSTLHLRFPIKSDPEACPTCIHISSVFL